MDIKDDMRIISLLLRSKKRVEVLKSLEFEDKIGALKALIDFHKLLIDSI